MFLLCLSSLYTVVPIKPTPKPRSIALDRVSQLSNQRASHYASHQKSAEYDAIEKMPSPEHSYSLEEQRVSEEDSCCVPSPAPDNSSSTPGQKSPIHTDSNEFSVESNASDSVEREDGKVSTREELVDCVILIFNMMFCVYLLPVIDLISI